jgi:hypothetical protein
VRQCSTHSGAFLDEAIADLDLTALIEVKPPRGYGRD